MRSPRSPRLPGGRAPAAVARAGPRRAPGGRGRRATPPGRARRRAACARPAAAARSRPAAPGARRATPPPDRHVQRLLRRRPRRVQHHQGRRVAVCGEPALEHLAAARHRRPVDARCRRALAVGAQPVQVQLGRGAVHPAAQRRTATAVGVRAATRRPAGALPPPPARRAAAPAALVARPVWSAWRTASRSGSWIESRPGSSTRRPRRAKRTSMRTLAGEAARQPQRLGEQRVVQLAPGRGHQRRAAARAAAGRAAPPPPCAGREPGGSRRPCAASPTHSAEPSASRPMRHPGHQQRGGVEQQRREHERSGQDGRARPPASRPRRPRACAVTGPAPCRARRARRPAGRRRPPREPAAAGG